MSMVLTRSLAALVLAGTVALATDTAAAHPDHEGDDVRPARLTSTQSNAIRKAALH